MLIPSTQSLYLANTPSLSRGMNANSQLVEGPVGRHHKSIKRDEC